MIESLEDILLWVQHHITKGSFPRLTLDPKWYFMELQNVNAKQQNFILSFLQRQKLRLRGEKGLTLDTQRFRASYIQSMTSPGTILPTLYGNSVLEQEVEHEGSSL